MAAQREAIELDCRRRGWELVTIYEDTASGKSLNGRPQLRAALAELAAGNAHVLMSSKLDRLSHSAVDFGGLLELARKQGWKVVVLDLGVDTSTPAGELVAGVMVQVAQFERRRIGERTSDALQAIKKTGKKLGRPRAVKPEAEAFVVGRRAQGASMREIADELTERGAAPRGGRWQVSEIQRILARNPLTRVA
jgi:DNA invertase Pin-like site-specific DNA recombinase